MHKNRLRKISAAFALAVAVSVTSTVVDIPVFVSAQTDNEFCGIKGWKYGDTDIVSVFASYGTLCGYTYPEEKIENTEPIGYLASIKSGSIVKSGENITDLIPLISTIKQYVNNIPSFRYTPGKYDNIRYNKP
ncbi:MAG: hypothetical protein ACERKN_19165 [Velocimicrobium sp.]